MFRLSRRLSRSPRRFSPGRPMRSNSSSCTVPGKPLAASSPTTQIALKGMPRRASMDEIAIAPVGRAGTDPLLKRRVTALHITGNGIRIG